MRTRELPKRSKELRAIVDDARDGTIILTENGRMVAAVVSLDDSDSESRALANNPRFLRIIRKSLKEIEEGKGMTLEEVRRRLGLDAPSARPRRSRRRAKVNA